MQDSKPQNATQEGEILFSPSSYADTKIVHEDLWNKILESVKRIVEKRFSEPAKRKPKVHIDRIAFACPYCGDSATDMGKKRGNLFIDSMNYHCFNGDCASHMSLDYFLKDQGEISNYTPDEIAHIKLRAGEASSTHVTKKIRVYQSVESLISEEAMSLTVSREFFMKRMKLQEIRGSRMDRYLTQRLQTNFERFGFDPKKGLLYVFNLTKDDTRILGYQIKTFSKRNAYLTYKTTGMHKELHIFKEENTELLAKMDTGKTKIMEEMVRKGSMYFRKEKGLQVAYMPQFWPEEITQGSVEDFFNWVKESTNPHSEKTAERFRKQLGEFGFRSDTAKLLDSSLSSLSGGEQRLVWFVAVSVLEGTDMLVLDEPTNHMDKAAVDFIAKAIKDFPGGVVLSTHDLRLMEKLGGNKAENKHGVVNWVFERSMKKCTSITVSKESPFYYSNQVIQKAMGKAATVQL
jgi:ABC-type Mn2+/Zn2+ transport system ATPase subunit